MGNEKALKLAVTGLTEVRLLLRAGKVQQALELAEALRNIPSDNNAYGKVADLNRSLEKYFSKYPDRLTLTHWKSVIKRRVPTNVSMLHHATRDLSTAV